MFFNMFVYVYITINRLDLKNPIANHYTDTQIRQMRYINGC